MVGDDRERGVVGSMCQAQESFPKFVGRLKLCPHHIKPPQTKQRRDQLWCLAHLLTQHACLGVGLRYLRRCGPFDHQ
jgi:hypothetical protein